MGTSTNYNAPPSWSGLKGEVTRAARDGRLTQAKARDLVRGLIESNGGGRAMTRGGGRGGGSVGGGGAARAVAQRLGGFIANVGAVGLNEALRREGLTEFIGRPVREVLAALLDRLGGSSSTIDDVDARAAMARLQDELFAEANDAQAIEDLMTKEAENLGSLLERYFGFYVYELFCRVFFERLTRLIGDAKATSFLGEIKSYIVAALTNRLGTREVASVDWAGSEGQRISMDIMEDTMSVFSVGS
jgi:hypothetical protein